MARDGSKCQKCGELVAGSNRHVSHVIPRSHSLRLMYDPINLKVLCFHHHRNFWHLDPVAAGQWFIETFPDRYAYLKEKEQDKAKITTADLEALYEELKAQHPRGGAKAAGAI